MCRPLRPQGRPGPADPSCRSNSRRGAYHLACPVERRELYGVTPAGHRRSRRLAGTDHLPARRGPLLPGTLRCRVAIGPALAAAGNHGHDVGVTLRAGRLGQRCRKRKLGGLGLSAEAAGAHQRRLRTAIDGDPRLVQIGHESALRVHLRVAHVMPVLGPLTADRAALCHRVWIALMPPQPSRMMKAKSASHSSTRWTLRRRPTRCGPGSRRGR